MKTIKRNIYSTDKRRIVYRNKTIYQDTKRSRPYIRAVGRKGYVAIDTRTNRIYATGEIKHDRY